MNTDDQALADLIAMLREPYEQTQSRRPSLEYAAADRLEAFHAKPVVGEHRCSVCNTKHGHAPTCPLSAAFDDESSAALQSPPPVVSGELVELLKDWRDYFAPDGKRIRLADGNKERLHSILGQVIERLSVPPVVGEGRREAIARIIDPDAFGDMYGLPNATVSKMAAEAKADAILALTPVEGVGESAAQRVVSAWRAVNTEFGSYFVDEDGPYREVRDMDEAVEALSTPATAQGDARRMLLGLLATIHRDGGQHVNGVGIEQAFSEAITLSAERIAQGDVREALELAARRFEALAARERESIQENRPCSSHVSLVCFEDWAAEIRATLGSPHEG